MPTQVLNKRTTYFGLFFLYNLCFFVLQLLFVCSHDGSFISTVSLPTKIHMELIATLGIHIGLYLLLSLIQSILLTGILKRQWHYFSQEQWQITIWFLFVFFLISANAYFFPLSQFSKLLSPPLSKLFIALCFYFSLLGISLLIFNSLLYKKGFVLLTSLSLVFCLTTINHYFRPGHNQGLHSKPNIIILGIDSLSPESIHKENMPFLTQLLANSNIQFTQAISPLARTYPSWASILTGLYAKHHHAEENLIARSRIKSKASILWTLKSLGYDSIYATDDRQFNSIDKDFGFQKIIGPKLGVNEILLGSFNDFPLSNLLINFKISDWIFPYNYSNRASYFAYYPETFNTKLQNELSQLPQNKPLFLAVHFTLPHWPYAWAESSPESLNNEFSLEKRDILYQSALKKVDEQYHCFFNYLKQHKYLSNSLLIILSDHGEALYYPNSRLTNNQNYQGSHPSQFSQYLKTKTATVLNKSAGHGSDILSPKQYHSLLAFNIYQQGKLLNYNKKIDDRVALIDLAPTILDFLHIPNLQQMDGISLKGSLINPKAALMQRAFYIESGIFPNQQLSKEKARKIGQEFYTINSLNGELELKHHKLDYFAKQKLYGIIKGNWILALYPDETRYIAIIQNLTNGQWTDDLHDAFAKKTPADQLYQKLKQFYGEKIFLPLP